MPVTYLDREIDSLVEERKSDFHIHFATERYQRLGTREDAYAVPTDRYVDYHGALRCCIEDVNLAVAADQQGELAFGSSRDDD